MGFSGRLRNNQANQVWTTDMSAQAIKHANQCFDLEGGYLTNNRARLIRYRCIGGEPEMDDSNC